MTDRWTTALSGRRVKQNRQWTNSPLWDKQVDKQPSLGARVKQTDRQSPLGVRVKQNDRQMDKQPSLGVRVKQNDRQMDKQPSLGVRVNRMTDRWCQCEGRCSHALSGST